VTFQGCHPAKPIISSGLPGILEKVLEIEMKIEMLRKIMIFRVYVSNERTVLI